MCRMLNALHLSVVASFCDEVGSVVDGSEALVRDFFTFA